MSQTLTAAAVAFTMVFLGMAILTGLMYTLNAIKHLVARRAATVAAAAPATAGGVDSATMAVLAAAVHAALGRSARIHRVHIHRERGDEAWTRVGRMDLLLTHRVVPKR